MPTGERLYHGARSTPKRERNFLATDQHRGLRLTPGELLAGIGGLTLLLALFIDWYGAEPKIDEEEAGDDITAAFKTLFELTGFNAWQSFAFLDIVLALIAVAAIVFAILRIADSLPPLPVSPGLVLAALGALALLIIIIRLIATPNPEITLGDETVKVKDDDEADVTRELWGPLFALLGALALAFGGFRASIERPGVAPRAAAPAGAGAPGFGAQPGGPIAGTPGAPTGGPLSGGPPPAAGAPPTQAAPSPEPAAQPAAGGPKADWYPDPHGQARLRYWDGSKWTDQTAD